MPIFIPSYSFMMSALFAVSLAAPALGQQSSSSLFDVPGFEIERVSWVGKIGDGAGVTVVNHFGDVRARFGGYEGQVEVLANVQQFATEGARLVVDTRESPTGIEITIGYRASDGSALVASPNPVHKKRADIVVFVPRDAQLSVTTDKGLVDVRGLQSDVSVRTNAGRFTARKIKGELDIQTGAGDAAVVLEQWDAVRKHSLTSASGKVSVAFGGEVDAAIRVATSGLISTDFSMAIDFQAERQPVRRGNTRVGKGVSVVSITSATGDVRLTRRPLANAAREIPGAGVQQ